MATSVTPAAVVPLHRAATLTDLAEPVRRYFAHALADGAPLSRRARLQLRGKIKVGGRLDFDSVWEGDALSFSWRATCGPGRLRLLGVHDQSVVARKAAVTPSREASPERPCAAAVAP